MSSTDKFVDPDLSKPTTSQDYRGLVGALMHTAIMVRFDIAYSVSILSRYLHYPNDSHWAAAVRVVQYLIHSIDFRLRLGGTSSSSYTDTELLLSAYSDSNWGSPRSVSGGALFFGRSLVGWFSRKQPCVALSSAEAEYTAQAEMVKLLVWSRMLVSELGFVQHQPSKLYSDSKAAIAIAKNPVHSSRSRHIDIKIHFVRHCVDNFSIELHFVSSSSNVSDIFTKPLIVGLFSKFCQSLGLSSMFSM